MAGYNRRRHGRHQPESVPDRSPFFWPGNNSGAGECRRSLVDCRADPQLDGHAGMDGAHLDVSSPGGRDCRHLSRSIQTLQPGPGKPDRCLLLVGLGTDMRIDCAVRGRCYPAIYPWCLEGDYRHHHRPGIHGAQSIRCKMDDEKRHSHCDCLGNTRIPICFHPNFFGSCRLDAGVSL